MHSVFDNRRIAIIDSGVGGLPYLEAARALLPSESYVYLADRQGFPYGIKSREEIIDIVVDRCSRLRAAASPKALVIACNTASQAALEAVRETYPDLLVIGTVPAVKPAAERSKTGVIGIMATAGAIRDPYLDQLLGRFAAGIEVIREPAQDLVAFVEHDLVAASPEKRIEVVLPYVRRIVEAGADEIVLACTHFLHLSRDIQAAARSLGREVEIVDSRAGVARRLKAVLAERGMLAAEPLADGASSPRISPFLLTGPRPYESAYSAFAARFQLSGPFPLDGAA